MAADSKFSFSSGMVSRAFWGREDIVDRYDKACKRLINFRVKPDGGVVRRSGTYFLSAAIPVPGDVVRRDGRLIPFVFNRGESYVLEFGEKKLRIIEYRGYLLVNNSPLEVETAYPLSVLPQLKSSQVNDVLTLTCPGHPVRNLIRHAAKDWRFSEVSFTNPVAKPTNLAVSFDSDFIPASSSVNKIKQSRFTYVVTSIDPETRVESLPSDSAYVDSVIDDAGKPRSYNSLTWRSPQDSSGNDSITRFNVYKEKNGIYGFIGSAEKSATYVYGDATKPVEITGATEGFYFKDNNIDPVFTHTPPKARNPFSSLTKYPTCSAHHLQRQVYAGSFDEPNTFHVSRVGLFNDFKQSEPIAADDAFSWTLSSVRGVDIRHMRSYGDNLFLFTSGGTKVISSDGEPFAIDTISVKPADEWPTSNVLAPILIGSTFVYAEEGEQIVRTLNYSFERNAYSGVDLTVLARDLFENRRIVSWAYSGERTSVIWCVMSDGSMLGLTFNEDHDVYAWHEHRTQGSFKSLSCVPQGTRNNCYFIVDRTSFQKVRTYVIESEFNVSGSDSYDTPYCDSIDVGFSFSSFTDSYFPPGTELFIYEGSYSRFNYVGKLPINASGKIDSLPDRVGRDTSSILWVGLPFESTLETLGVSFQQRAFTAGYPRTINKLSIWMSSSLGIEAGPDEDHLSKYKAHRDLEYGRYRDFESGLIDINVDSSWRQDASIVIKQRTGSRANIDGIIADVEYFRASQNEANADS